METTQFEPHEFETQRKAVGQSLPGLQQREDLLPFSTAGCRVVRCDDCGLVFLNPQPSDDELARIQNKNYCLGNDSEDGRQAASGLKEATARRYLSEIRRYHGSQSGRLLEVGCGEGDFLVSAEAAGWQVTGVEFSPVAGKRAQQRLKNGEVWSGICSRRAWRRNSLISVLFPM